MTTDMPVLGIRLTLTATADGGRNGALLGGSDSDARMKYRPNWGLPGWEDGRQSGAPVLGFAASDIQPGDTTNAVIVPLFAESEPAWWSVSSGDVLRMYEGSRIVGIATVLWTDRSGAIRDGREQARLLARIGE